MLAKPPQVGRLGTPVHDVWAGIAMRKGCSHLLARGNNLPEKAFPAAELRFPTTAQ
jgi:hypothetical protein